MYIGDSLSLNNWQSLICLLHAAVPNSNITQQTTASISSVTFEVSTIRTLSFPTNNVLLVDKIDTKPCTGLSSVCYVVPLAALGGHRRGEDRAGDETRFSEEWRSLEEYGSVDLQYMAMVVSQGTSAAVSLHKSFHSYVLVLSFENFNVADGIIYKRETMCLKTWIEWSRFVRR